MGLDRQKWKWFRGQFPSGLGNGVRQAPGPDKVRVVNRAIGGRSSRTFLTEGKWEQVAAELKAGDFLMIQFGHNDGGELFKGTRPARIAQGIGDEVRDGIVEQSGKEEQVHTYGWYLRTYISDTISKVLRQSCCLPFPETFGGKARSRGQRMTMESGLVKLLSLTRFHSSIK